MWKSVGSVCLVRRVQLKLKLGAKINSSKQKCGWIGYWIKWKKTMSFRLCTHRQIDTDRINSLHVAM